MEGCVQKVTVEPLNKDTFGTSRFVLCREVVLFSEVINYRVCIHEHFRLVLCWEVCRSSFGVSFIGGFTGSPATVLYHSMIVLTR